MKIKITEIECNAEELRQSNSLSEAFTNMLRGVFTPFVEDDDEGEGGLNDINRYGFAEILFRMPLFVSVAVHGDKPQSRYHGLCGGYLKAG